MPDFTIDPEFQRLIPPLSPEEYAELEENLLRDGCRGALVVWDEANTLLDGHNRNTICSEHSLSYRTAYVSLPDRDAAKVWIIANQIGRRNLTKEQLSMYRARLYELAEKKQGARTDLTSAQNEPRLTTAEKVAKKTGTSASTVKRDVQFKKDVESLKAIDSDIEAKVNRREAPPRKTIEKAAKALKESPEKAQMILDGTATKQEDKPYSTDPKDSGPSKPSQSTTAAREDDTKDDWPSRPIEASEAEMEEALKWVTTYLSLTEKGKEDFTKALAQILQPQALQVHQCPHCGLSSTADTVPIGEQIRLAMIRRDVKQEPLAKAVSPAHIPAHEKLHSGDFTRICPTPQDRAAGKRPLLIPTKAQRQRLAEMLGVEARDGAS